MVRAPASGDAMADGKASGKRRGRRLGTILLAALLVGILLALLLVVLWCWTPRGFRGYEPPRGLEAAVLQNTFDQELSHVLSELAAGRPCTAAFYDTEVNAFLRAKNPLPGDYARLFGPPVIAFEDGRVRLSARAKHLVFGPVVTLLIAPGSPGEGLSPDRQPLLVIEKAYVGALPVGGGILARMGVSFALLRNDAKWIDYMTAVDFGPGLVELLLRPNSPRKTGRKP